MPTVLESILSKDALSFLSEVGLKVTKDAEGLLTESVNDKGEVVENTDVCSPDKFKTQWAIKKIDEICKLYVMKLDSQDMQLEGLDRTQALALENILEEVDFKTTRTILGYNRVLYGRIGCMLHPYSWQGQKKMWVEACRINIFQMVFGKLTTVTTMSIQQFKHNSGMGYFYTTYILKGNRVQVQRIMKDSINAEPIKYTDWNVDVKAEEYYDIDFIPVQLFDNDYQGRSEFALYWDMLNNLEHQYNNLMKETINSRTRLILNKAILSGDADKLRNSLMSDQADVIMMSAPDASFGQAITNIASLGSLDALRTHFDWEVELLHKMMKLPIEIEDGTKNKHNLEVSQDQDSVRNNLEAKKSTVIQQYQKFLKMILKVAVKQGLMSLTPEQIDKVEIYWEDPDTEQELQESLNTKHTGFNMYLKGEENNDSATRNTNN